MKRMNKILALICACVMMISCTLGCAPVKSEPTDPDSLQATNPPVVEIPTEAPTEAPTEVPTEPATEAPTEAPTEPKEEPVTPPATEPAPVAPTEPVVEPTEPEVEPTEPEEEPTEPEEDENGGFYVELSGEVTSENNVLSEGVTLAGDTSVSANVPQGVVLDNNTTQLTLTVTQKETSESGVELTEGQTMLPLDVHIQGVSTENTTPIMVNLGAILPKGLNIGNYSLYHVENGVSNKMNAVSTVNELSAHNDFVYDPADGNVVISVYSFSEIALVANTNNIWNGAIDKNLSGSGTEDDPYIISNADELAGMSKLVSESDAYAAAHYLLISDVDFGGYENTVDSQDNPTNTFYPIGYWKEFQDGETTYYGYGNSFTGVFDGNGNAVRNICQRTWDLRGSYEGHYWNHAMGLFGAVYGAKIKNLIIDGFESDGEFTPTGCVAAYAGGPECLFENIILTNCNPRVYNTGNGGIVGLNYNSTNGTPDDITFRNVTVDNSNKITALWGSWDVACGGIMGRVRENSKHDHANGEKNTVHFENCHVSAVIDVYNDVCANYQYYQYRYCGMFIGTVDYIDDVPSIGMNCVTAANCTYKIGTWNEYWYCELVANSLASYTHDHQFSRLEKIASIAEISDDNGETWKKAGNFVIPATNEEDAVCYHIVEKDGVLVQHKHEDSGKETVGGEEILKEDRQHYMMSFNQLFTGYGWGSKPVYEFAGINHTGEEASNEKFAVKDTFLQLEIKQGDSVKVEDIFKLLDGAKINTSSLNIYLSPADEDSSVVAQHIKVMSGSDWGELTFNGIGNAKITITDYYYCTPTVIEIVVGELVDDDLGDWT